MDRLHRGSMGEILTTLAYIPDLSISDNVLLNIFFSGLDMKSALDIDITAGGSFAHRTPT